MSQPPTTIAEAVEQLQQRLTPDELSAFAALPEDDLDDCHFGLGQYVRNELGLWDPNSPLLRDCRAGRGARAAYIHPADTSMVIVRTLWARLHH